MMSKVKIFNEADRLAVASILVKNGYKVSQGKERIPGKKSYVYFVEYEETDSSAGGTGDES